MRNDLTGHYDEYLLEIDDLTEEEYFYGNYEYDNDSDVEYVEFA